MVSFKDACATIEKHILQIPLDIEEVKLQDALERTIAEDVYTTHPYPLFRNSTMDGIAVKYSGNITSWKVVGQEAAGEYVDVPYEDENSAVSIMTGAKLPDWADTVIPIEDIDAAQDMVMLKTSALYKPQMNIREPGSDRAAGDFVLARGTYLAPRHFHLLASCGCTWVKVYKKLKVGILATGNELLPVSAIPEGDKIIITNSSFLAAAVNSCNLEYVDFGIAKDDLTSLRNLITKILSSDINVLLTTGGVSAGLFDFLPKVFAECGVDVQFHKINIKPGKPTFFGIHNAAGKAKPVIGLPGNPVSASVNFEMLLRPAFARRYNVPLRRSFTAQFKGTLQKNDGKRYFGRARLLPDAGKTIVVPLASQKSGNFFEYADAECLFVMEEGRRELIDGDVVECIRI